MSIQEVILLFLTLCLTQLAVRTDDTDNVEMTKRAPGWGKREAPSKMGYLESMLTDLSRLEMNKDNLDIDLNKRRPGWGKRSYPVEYELDKRKPGWGKRSSGYDTEPYRFTRTGLPTVFASLDGDLYDGERNKRRPGWGKRSLYDDMDMDKRRPGWGKRAPGWGKRSGEDSICKDLTNEMRLLRMKLAQMREELFESCSIDGLDDRMTFGS